SADLRREVEDDAEAERGTEARRRDALVRAGGAEGDDGVVPEGARLTEEELELARLAAAERLAREVVALDEELREAELGGELPQVVDARRIAPELEARQLRSERRMSRRERAGGAGRLRRRGSCGRRWWGRGPGHGNAEPVRGRGRGRGRRRFAAG